MENAMLNTKGKCKKMMATYHRFRLIRRYLDLVHLRSKVFPPQQVSHRMYRHTCRPKVSQRSRLNRHPSQRQEWVH